MALDSPYFGSQETTNLAPAMRIEMLSEYPNPNLRLEPPKTPNSIVGFYNGATNAVELYMVSASGHYYVRMSGGNFSDT